MSGKIIKDMEKELCFILMDIGNFYILKYYLFNLILGLKLTGKMI